MKKIFINFGLVFTTIITLLVTGCETLDLEVKDSPNALSPLEADVDFFLNSIQLELTDFVTGIEGGGNGMSEIGMETTRMFHGFGPSYRELNIPDDFNEIWGIAYSDALADIRAMNPLAKDNQQFTHIAIGQIIESYIMMSLVDYFGDIPYSEALQGVSGILNPKIDSGASIYEAIDLLLIDAVTNLNKEELLEPTNDLYYNGDESKWEKLANTLRLKLYLQTRLVDTANSTNKINALINNGNLILNTSDDFQFQYGTNISAPDSRHPFYEKTYGGTGPSAAFYMSNYYMDLLANNFSIADPRTRYYFYRQVGDYSGASVITKDCAVMPMAPDWYSPNDVYCTVADTNGFSGFWGRDHLDPDGIPPDTQFRTLVGVYPSGGAFDDNSYRNLSGSTAPIEGLQGAGISPIMLSSYTNFMLAEAALTMGTTGNALSYLEDGMRESINKTLAFGSSLATSSTFVPSSTDIESYITDVLARYNAGSDDDKLKVIVEQYFIALWGNGVEAYNTYRRTGQPSDLQPAVELKTPGTFIRSHWYPGASVNNNSNITQKANVSIPVFWDNNPEGFVD